MVIDHAQINVKAINNYNTKLNPTNFMVEYRAVLECLSTVENKKKLMLCISTGVKIGSYFSITQYTELNLMVNVIYFHKIKKGEEILIKLYFEFRRQIVYDK